MIKKILSLFLLGLLLASGGYYFFVITPKIAQQKAVMMAKAMPTPEVTVLTIKKEPVQTFRELPARIAAFRISEVRPQIEGVIKERKFEEGSFVKQGEQLYQIDPNVYDITLKNTKTSFERMRSRRDRYKLLLKEDAISQQEFDDSEADFAKAEADFKLAQTNSNYAKVLAPISGYVGKSNVTEGALATTNQTTVLTTITQLDPIYIDMIQPSKESIKSPAQKNMAVSLLVDDEKYDHDGELKFAEKFADEATDSVRLRAQIVNPDGKLIPGMFVTAQLHLPLFDAITVPQRATMRAANGELFVFILENGNTVKQRPIKVSQAVDNRWIVIDGLAEGETLIYEGLQKIADGTKVIVAAPTDAQAPTTNPQDKK